MSCPDAFNCLNIEAKDGETYISSCCVMPSWKVDNIDFINDENFKRIREQWNDGEWPDECSYCRTAEDRGDRSRRHGSIEWEEVNLNDGVDYTDKILKIDYWTGNNCNLRCAICGPRFSVAWQKELGIEKQKRVTQTNKFWKTLDVDEVKWVHFNGGEPMLVDEHWELLKKIKNKENVVLNYNTNASVLPKPELVDLWSQFKLVVLDFSIDDIGKRFEYQRYPAKWEKIVENLFWFREQMPVNVMFGVNTSLGILNYNNYHHLKNWFNENFSTNRVTDPVRLGWQSTNGILSKDVKDKRKVVEYLNRLDKRRGSNWRETFPELIDFLYN